MAERASSSLHSLVADAIRDGADKKAAREAEKRYAFYSEQKADLDQALTAVGTR